MPIVSYYLTASDSMTHLSRRADASEFAEQRVTNMKDLFKNKWCDHAVTFSLSATLSPWVFKFDLSLKVLHWKIM